MTTRMPRVALIAFALGALSSRAEAAPVSAHLLPIQGVVRDVNDAPIPTGNVAVRVYADSLGGSPAYNSGTEFSGAVIQGVFDVLAGQTTSLMLDPEHRYFLELDVAGVEMIGDAAGGRWAFYPGGGSRARPDLEARLDNLEAAMGLSARSADRAPARVVVSQGSVPAKTASAYSNQHALLGLGTVTGSAGGYQVSANLLATPIGSRVVGGNRLHLGPYALSAPFPNPMIRFVQDVRNDQGRAVRVRWSSDLRERAYSPSDTLPRVTSYTLYRRVPAGQAAAVRASSAHLLPLPPGDWDVLTTVPATLDSTYQTVVPTLCDSTSSGICWSTFFVRAITDRVGVYYTSAVDSGFSVDNLAPNVPEGLTLQTTSGGTALSWQPSTAPDFQYFRVYRGADPDFPPALDNLVMSTTATSWTDSTHGAFTYKVTALDFNGNESPPAVASTVVSVENRAPTAFAFTSLGPNPFHRHLSLAVDVPPACGRVDVTVFDLSGRRVRTLVSRVLPEGRHTFTWDGRTQGGRQVASGVYAVRVTGAGRAVTRRATFIP